MFDELFPHRPFVFGMVHLGPLPGAPRFGGSFDEVVEAARRDARALAKGGVDAIMVENFGDVPFARERVGAVTVACLAVAARAVAEEAGLPLGVNVLRNDGQSAVAVAVATGASFIRVNVLAGARLTDQGLIQGIAHDLLRDRAALGATGVGILADISVKHSRPLAPDDLLLDAEELVGRSGADALIVTGETTGRPADPGMLEQLRPHVQVPLVVGSGATAESAPALARLADGFIVGTWFKEGGRLDAPVDPARVRRFMQALGRRGPARKGT